MERAPLRRQSCRSVSNHDLASLRLADCGATTDVSYGEHTLSEGSYQFTLVDTPLHFEAPAGLRLEIVGFVVSDAGEGGASSVGLILRNTAGRSWICLDVEQAEECNRWVSASNAGTVQPLLDRLAESAWMGESP